MTKKILDIFQKLPNVVHRNTTKYIVHDIGSKKMISCISSQYLKGVLIAIIFHRTNLREIYFRNERKRAAKYAK